MQSTLVFATSTFGFFLLAGTTRLIAKLLCAEPSLNRRKNPSYRSLILFALGAIPLCAAVAYIYWLNRICPGNELDDFDHTRIIYLVYWFTGFAALEEVLFRGFLLGGLLKTRIHAPNLIQTSVFAAAHTIFTAPTLGQAFTYVLIGYLLGLLALELHSLMIGTTVHAAYNLSTFLLLEALEATRTSQQADCSFVGSIGVLAVSVVAFAYYGVSALIIWTVYRHSEHNSRKVY
jgi:membrane protease YdiL (CAAX protease family)